MHLSLLLFCSRICYASDAIKVFVLSFSSQGYFKYVLFGEFVEITNRLAKSNV
jgi:hypothetical protein